jgi:hypothetical protein
MHIAFALACFIALPSDAEPLPASKYIQKIMAKADGRTPGTAFKVSSVEDEYQIAAALGLKVKSQSLIILKKPYDFVKAENEAGEAHEVWFDISIFYPEF